MIVCSNCAQENPASARFCLACGFEVAPERRAGDERRVVSVIFVDLVGFTARAERLDPEEVRAVLVPYHERVRREIESFGGVVEKFIGDAVMGVFGAPLAHGDDAERAVRAALVVRDSIRGVAGGDLQVRIAVNTGEAMVALGARPALGESMVAGDVVNTASRLQAAAPVGGVAVGEETYRTTKDAIEYEQLEPVTVKGKEQALNAWLAIRPSTEVGVRPLPTGIVGRALDLEILMALWSRVSSEQIPHLVSVIGPAGIGKSTIAAEFARVTEAQGARVVFGRSLPYRESGTYGALAGQLMTLSDVFESDPVPVIVSRLKEKAGALLGGGNVDADVVAGHLSALVGVDGGADPGDRDALFYSVREFLEATAREQPTILVFEDIHWGDASLLDLVQTLAARIQGLPILFFALARPELLDTCPGWGSTLPGYTTLTLAPLGQADARELIRRRIENEPQIEEVLGIAEGNPLFIEQLVAGLGEARPGTLPTNVREIVAARLDALPASERAVLLDAAVVGRVFWLEVLQALRRDEGDLLHLIGELERRDLVRREPKSIIEGQQQFAITHSVIRDVAYDLLPRADRAKRHAVIAEFFGRATGGSGEAIGALARHWRAAGDHERAVEQLLRAAEVAERGWAKEHATFLYREALGLVPEADTERRNAVRRKLALASSASFHLNLADVRRGKVVRRDVAGDLVDRIDLVLPEPAGMSPNHLDARRAVDTERPHLSGRVDNHVAVLPGDLGELLLDELARTASDARHLTGLDIETPDDHVTRHDGDDNCDGTCLSPSFGPAAATAA